LNTTEDIEIIGEANNGFEVLEQISNLNPQVLLLDMKIPGLRSSKIQPTTNHNLSITFAATNSQRV
jgi:DNA-binding NarL/FixJ family response regulator